MSPKRKLRVSRKSVKETPHRAYKSTNGERRKDRLAIEFELDRQIQQHVGKWVAIADDKIVAVGDDIEEVMDASRKLGYELPLVVRGPLTADESFYVL